MKLEKKPTYYDSLYKGNPHYTCPPEKSIYFPLWAMILTDTLPDEKIIELGCGSGQLANLLHRHQRKYRLGIDFSMQAVGMAKKMNPELDFICENAFHFLDIAPPFDTVIITEVLEHVTYDTELLAKIPAGKRVIFSVPNFDDPAHIRYFDNEQLVLNRYGKYFKHTKTQTHSRGKQTWFLISAVKK